MKNLKAFQDEALPLLEDLEQRLLPLLESGTYTPAVFADLQDTHNRLRLTIIAVSALVVDSNEQDENE